nr:MAG: internal scaffolding protein [Microvirus sp.]
MYHPLTQIDSPEERDRRSLASGIVCDLDADPTRQEYAEQCDINWIVERFGGNLVTGIKPRYGENHFDLDLMGAMQVMSDAAAQFEALPPKLRQAYPTISSLVEALNRGELTLTPTEPGSEAPAATQEPQTGSPAGAPPANPPAGTA